MRGPRKKVRVFETSSTFVMINEISVTLLRCRYKTVKFVVNWKKNNIRYVYSIVFPKKRSRFSLNNPKTNNKIMIFNEKFSFLWLYNSIRCNKFFDYLSLSFFLGLQFLFWMWALPNKQYKHLKKVFLLLLPLECSYCLLKVSFGNWKKNFKISFFLR